MKYIIYIAIFYIIYCFVYRKYRNPYKLYLVFGKKGSGKSTFLAKMALRYKKKKYKVYTNMPDLRIDGVRLIDAEELGEFVPEENSLIVLDEAGILYDNRNYRTFSTEKRDFYKLQRHYKVVVYLASQTYDIDLKLRNLTDGMYLVQNIGIVWSLIRPVHKSITLTEASAEGESRIAENLRFDWVFSWRMAYIPKYSRYFESFKVPERPRIAYEVIKAEMKRPKRKLLRWKKRPPAEKNFSFDHRKGPGPHLNVFDILTLRRTKKSGRLPRTETNEKSSYADNDQLTE